MKFRIFVHQNKQISIASEGVSIKHGKGDKADIYFIEAPSFESIKVIKKAKKYDIEVLSKKKLTIDVV